MPRGFIILRPSPGKCSQASISAASSQRPRRIPNVIKRDLEKIARAKRLAAELSAKKAAAETAAAENAAAEAATFAAAKLEEEMRLAEERSASVKASEQIDLEEQAFATRVAEERDALAILASQAAHQLDDGEDSKTATVFKSSFLSAISGEVLPLTMDDQYTPLEHAEGQAQSTNAEDTTSISFRTKEGFTDWANECLEASHEMSISDKPVAYVP